MESAAQEIDETLYWLELVGDAALATPDLLAPVLAEADELMRIFTTIAKNRKRI